MEEKKYENPADFKARDFIPLTGLRSWLGRIEKANENLPERKEKNSNTIIIGLFPSVSCNCRIRHPCRNNLWDLQRYRIFS
jgi:hypothetical protein